jgi:hypothetical protein
MIPSWWQFALLALAAYRLTRLIGWDEFPLAVHTRARLTGEYWIGEEVWYDRPTLAHLVSCPFCVGWWISLACYGAWQGDHKWTLIVLAPLAVSGVVGLIAKNLDA